MLKCIIGTASKKSAENGTGWNPPIVWNKKVPNSEINKFKKIIEEKYNLHFDSYWDFHKWSIEHYDNFWEEVWNYFGIITSKPYEKVVVKTGNGFLDYDWFPGAAFNYAENILRIRDDRVALIYLDETGYEETVTFAEMFEEVKLYSAAFRKQGLKIGDTVAGYMSNRKEAIFAMLATTSIGAIWSGPQPYYGARAAANIIRKMEAKFLITIDHHQDNGKDYNLMENLPIIANSCPTLQKIIIIPTKDETLTRGISQIRNGCSLEEFLQSGRNPDGSVPDIVFEQLPSSHPVCINFTSGTTGLPKGPVHSAVTLIACYATAAFHDNLKSNDVVLNLFPDHSLGHEPKTQCTYGSIHGFKFEFGETVPNKVGWSLWDGLIPSLGMGIKIVLYCGSCYFKWNGANIWDIIAKYKVSITYIVPSVLDKLEKLQVVPSPTSNLENFRTLMMCGCPAKIHNFQYIHNMVKKDLFIASQYGATEAFACFSGFDLNMPYYAGEVQAFGLGMDVRCVDKNGRDVVGERGEIVIGTPNPSFLINLWKDVDNKIVNATYFSKYPGIWWQGDEGWINPATKGLIVCGRSDDALIQNGEKFGAADVYFAIHDIEEIMDYICVNQSKKNGQCRAVLFVKLKEVYKFTPELHEKIASTISRELFQDCVPEAILEVPDIPYNVNNKRMESLVRQIVATNQIPEVNNIRNPDSLKHFIDIPEILEYDVL